MSSDLRPGPDSPPTDELASAEATLAVLQHSVERQIVGAFRPALDAWHRRGLDATAKIGPNKLPAAVGAAILSLEFLVHAWDYATATGHPINVADSVNDYVLKLARKSITPEGRATAGCDVPVAVPDDASALDRLIPFTGRNPAAAKA